MAPLQILRSDTYNDYLVILVCRRGRHRSVAATEAAEIMLDSVLCHGEDAIRKKIDVKDSIYKNQKWQDQLSSRFT